MRVIMLDNDGVICLSNNWGSRFNKLKKEGFITINEPDIPVYLRFDNFDKKAINVLNSILEETGAEIVVSSDWQNFATCEELGDYYESQGIIKRPIGVTKEIGGIDLNRYENFPWDRDFDLEQHRTLEILSWLDIHPEVTHWVAVDDLHMGIHVENSWRGPFDRDWGLSNFVWTPKKSEGIKQSGIKEKILKYLTT